VSDGSRTQSTSIPPRASRTPAAPALAWPWGTAWPDRPLEFDPARDGDSAGDPPRVLLKAGYGRPFLFTKMVDDRPSPRAMGQQARPGSFRRAATGDLVQLVDRTGRAVGFGLYNAASQIRVRPLVWIDGRGGEALSDSQTHRPPGRQWWRDRFRRAIALREELLQLHQTTNAFRLIHAEGDGLPGLIVDRFDDILSIEVFSLAVWQRLGPIVAELAQLTGCRHAHVRFDERPARAEGAIPQRLATPDAPPRTIAREGSLRMRVDFREGHKTGFFCDQRDNRRRLTAFTAGRNVLDVCCYTGGFALAAKLQGGAAEVQGVDLDEKAIALARENAHLNQVRVSFVQSDAFGYLRQMAVNQRRFGVIVLDPPKLIADRESFEEGRRKYGDLNTLAFPLVEPGGLLVTCSCSGLLSQDDFLSVLRSSARRAGRTAQVLAVTGAGADHPIGLDTPEAAYLKAVWLRVGSDEPLGDDLDSPC